MTNTTEFKNSRSHSIVRICPSLLTKLEAKKEAKKARSVSQVINDILKARVAVGRVPATFRAPPITARHRDLFTPREVGAGLKAMSQASEVTIGTMIYNILLEEVSDTDAERALPGSSRAGLSRSASSPA